MKTTSKNIILLLILMLFSTFGLANEEVDSLIHQINTSSRIRKIDARLELSFYCRRSNFDISVEQASIALQEAQKINNLELQAQALYYLGLANHYNDYNDPGEKTMKYFNKALVIAQKTNKTKLLGELYYFIGSVYYLDYSNENEALINYNKSVKYSLIANNYRILGAVYSSLSNMFRISGSYEKALEFLNKSRDNYTLSGVQDGIAWVNYMTGTLYSTIGLFEEAEKSFKEALEIYLKLAAIDGNMNGVAICYDQLGVINTDMHNEESARNYNQDALNLHTQSGSKYGISNSLKYLARIEYFSENYDAALIYLDSSLTIKRTTNEQKGYASIYELFGLIFIENNEYSRAIDSLEMGLYHAHLNNQLKDIMKMNKHLAKIYNSLGQYDKAYNYKFHEISIADSIYNSNITRNMLQLETLYKIQQKEDQIKQLEQENFIQELSLSRENTIRNYLIFILSLSLIIILIFFYFYRAKYRANIELEKTKKHLDELNATKDKFFSIISHDLRSPFNSILGLSNLLKENSRKYDADKMEKIISAIYKSSHASYALLNNLLEWSRTQTGSIKFSPESFILIDVMKDVMDLLSNNAAQKDVHVSYETKSLSLYADKNMIHT
ncbi:MAG: tetratricopeptide repeat protein, partial [Candidatus Marinimicrobia bacterium]|nr:tetratricopeptide repeat protein [Candidatus Neomarinimicrobiota bacterium]